MTSREIAIPLSVAALAAGLGIAWFSSRAHPAGATATDRDSVDLPALDPPRRSVTPSPPASVPTPAAEVILDVVIDPPTVCAGSDALVRVQLAAPYLDGAVTVAGSLANPAIVRASGVGLRRVPIQVQRHGQRVAELEASFHAVDCGEDAARLVVVARRRGPGRVEGLVAIARGVQPGLLRWDFGDGTFLETEDRSVTHQYAPTEERTTHVVSVTGTSSRGERVVGRTHFTARPLAPVDLAELELTLRTLAARENEQAALRAQEVDSPDDEDGHEEAP